MIFFDLFSLSYFGHLLYKCIVYQKSKIILENRFLDIYFCPFLKNENTFGKKKLYKNEEKAETIKKFKVWSLKKVFQICDDNFFLEKMFNKFNKIKNLNNFYFSNI